MAMARVLTVMAAFAAATALALTTEEKVAKLNELTWHGKGAISLDTKTFTAFIEHPRNYSLIVVLTATDASHACDVCQSFAPEFDIVANSWRAVAEPGRLYFGVLEYRDGTEIFRRLKVTTAPQVLHFPPSDGRLGKQQYQKDPFSYEPYDGRSSSFSAEDFGRYVEGIVGREVRPVATGRAHVIPLNRPFNWGRLLITLAVVALAIYRAPVLYRYLEPVLKRPFVWGVVAVVFTLIFITGHAYNSIRNVPFINPRESISSSFQSQFGVETWLMAMLYGSGSLSLLLLSLHVPTVTDQNTQRTFAYVYAVLFILSTSAIVGVFRYKMPSYPFRILF